MTTIPKTLAKFLTNIGREKHYTIAYSGGVDSHVLLHAFKSLHQKVKAVHVHHGLSPNADSWATHCEKTCADLKIDLKVLHVDVSRDSKHGLEGEARKKRYEAIGQCLNSDDYLLTGHHQDDQVETVLLQLFRGTGVKGLAGMASIKVQKNFILARPLLNCSRLQIVEYAKANNLVWIDDESNADESLRRNFVRRKIIPKLQTLWPQVDDAIANAAAHCREIDDVLSTLLQERLKLMVQDGRLKVGLLQQEIRVMQAALIRAWLESQGVLMPSAAVLERIIEDVVNASPAAHPLVRWGDYSLRCLKGEMWVDVA